MNGNSGVPKNIKWSRSSEIPIMNNISYLRNILQAKLDNKLELLTHNDSLSKVNIIIIYMFDIINIF